MDLKTHLQASYSKINLEKAKAYVGKSRERFADLMQLFFGEDKRSANGAAWLVSHIAEAQPSLVLDYRGQMIQYLSKSQSSAIRRSIFRSLQFLALPQDEEELGLMADHCFKALESSQESIAAKVFAMSNLEKICQIEPDLIPEFKDLLNLMIPEGSPGIKARAKKTLQRLKSN